MSHAIPCIRLQGRFVTMMNALVSGWRETLPLLPESMNSEMMIQKAVMGRGGALCVSSGTAGKGREGLVTPEFLKYDIF